MPGCSGSARSGGRGDWLGASAAPPSGPRAGRGPARAPAAGRADVPHVVAPGESLTSIAAADELSVSALAAANRLAPDARLIAGSVIQTPPQRAGTRRAPASTRRVTAPARDAD